MRVAFAARMTHAAARITTTPEITARTVRAAETTMIHPTPNGDAIRFVPDDAAMLGTEARDAHVREIATDLVEVTLVER